MIKKLFFFFLLIPAFVFSQDVSIIKGKVVSESSLLEGIHIINLSKKNGVVTDSRGYFEISAKISDTLQFSAVNLKARRYVLTANDFSKDLVFVKMESFAKASFLGAERKYIFQFLINLKDDRI